MKKRPSIDELQQQIGELTDALQRERADSLNLRRRTEEERTQMADFYKAMIIREILPIVDSCEKLLEHIPAHSKEAPWKEGAEKVVKQTQKILADLGVERIKTVGEHFDPHLHEAVHLDESDPPMDSTDSPQAGSGQAADEIVSEELQAGYKIGDEVIRPAMVKVKKEKK